MSEVRMLRAAAASLVVALCGSGAHVMAGGTVAAWVVPLLVIGAFPVALLITGQRLGASQMLGLLALGQVAVHVVAGHAAGEGSLMAASHLLATAVSLVILRHGEDAWWRVADALGMLMHRVRPQLRVAVPRHRALHAVIEPWFPRLDVLVSGVGGRSPPRARH